MITLMVSVGVLSIVAAIASLMRESREFFALCVPLAERKPMVPERCKCRWCWLSDEIQFPDDPSARPSLVRPYMLEGAG